MLRATPFQAMRVTYAFISKAFEKDAQLCRDTFFSKALPEADVQRCVVETPCAGASKRLLLLLQRADVPYLQRSYMAKLAANGAVRVRAVHLRACGGGRRGRVGPGAGVGAAAEATIGAPARHARGAFV
jgi:hypothetical protein